MTERSAQILARAVVYHQYSHESTFTSVVAANEAQCFCAEKLREVVWIMATNNVPEWMKQMLREQAVMGMYPKCPRYLEFPTPFVTAFHETPVSFAEFAQRLERNGLEPPVMHNRTGEVYRMEILPNGSSAAFSVN